MIESFMINSYSYYIPENVKNSQIISQVYQLNTNTVQTLFDVSELQQYYCTKRPINIQCRLLQGIVTKDIRQFEKLQTRSIYTYFLNPKGRVVSDAFLYKPAKIDLVTKQKKIVNDEIWISTHNLYYNTLMKHISKYVWKKDVNLQIFTQQNRPKMYASYSQAMKSLDQKLAGCQSQYPTINQQLEEDQYLSMMIYDPRSPLYGLHILSGEDGIEQNQQDFVITNQDHYNSFLIHNGVVPTQLMIDKLPFQFNADFLNGISKNKGCYLGQQIVSRGYFTGIIRRRTFPFIVQNNFDANHQNQKIVSKQGKDLGKILFIKRKQDFSSIKLPAHYLSIQTADILNEQAYGIALVNYLDLFDQNWPIQISEPFNGLLLNPYGEKLAQYNKAMLKNKQTLEYFD